MTIRGPGTESNLHFARRSWWMSAGALIKGFSALVFGAIISILTINRMAFLLAVLISLYYFFVALYINRSLSILLTTHRITAKFGFFKNVTSTFNLNKIEILDVEQNFIGRVLGYGTIILRGSGGEDVYLTGISDPRMVKSLAFQAIDNL